MDISLRLYQLAEELNMDCSSLIKKLEELHIIVKSNESSLADDVNQGVLWEPGSS